MRPQDIVILLKIIVKGDRPWTQLMLARELFMSQSEISESLARSKYAGLFLAKKAVHREALLGFLVYGLPYVFPQKPGPVQRGIVTAHSAAPLTEVFVGEDPYVWPYAKGESRGKAITPLYPSVVQAVELDAELHQLLALVDTLRVGRAREKQLAIRYLKDLLRCEIPIDCE